MPKYNTVKKVLVIGSGPIVIGQAAEFDYAGTQACRALREEGMEVVLINSNPATIMTDTDMADRVYIEPLHIEHIKNIIRRERPDSLVPGLGGQTGLNMAMELYDEGFLDEMNVRLLGTPAQSIRRAEDREAFRDMMMDMGEPVIANVIANDVESCVAFAEENGYPVIVRPAYTLGGTGGGIAATEQELRMIVEGGLRASRVHQVLIEKSLVGYQEIEFEAMRDSAGNKIIICDMENVDPVGVHTGDSIVVAPCLSLPDAPRKMLRESALRIIDELEIEGGCNVQYALAPDNSHYYVIEVNPRVSRSSALASKATGYPIARVSAKVALGLRLDEIENGLTGCTKAIDEPRIDYTVVKFPRLPFDKFTKAEKSLGTRMKATGEVMAIGGNFQEALMKAVRSLEIGRYSLTRPDEEGFTDRQIFERIEAQDDMRMFYIAEALRRHKTIDKIYQITQITPWFLEKIQEIVKLEEALRKAGSVDAETLLKAKKMGFADKAIAGMTGVHEKQLREMRRSMNIRPAFGKVDTVAGEIEVQHPYYYSTYHKTPMPKEKGKTVVVLGSGPIRIGQGIEFDYCSVHCVWALARMGYETVIINCNPETVSTDYDTSDRLYFEPCTPEDVLEVLDREQPVGVVVQFGGQTAIKLTAAVQEAGYPILGTQREFIDMAEDREEFEALLEREHIARPRGGTALSAQEAVDTANAIGYPVLVRPSFVLGGQGMEIAYEERDIREYMEIIEQQGNQKHPVLIDKYIQGIEVEVDAISDGESILIPGIMEHIERTGVHSGDSISVYPSRRVTEAMKRRIYETTKTLARELHTVGLINIQYIVDGENLHVIEVNPRSSRTVPYISKVTGIAMIDRATRAMLGEKLTEQGIAPEAGLYAVKVPVFSFEKLPNVEVSLGPEMKSTGEVLGIAPTLAEALYKGLVASGLKIQAKGAALISINKNDRQSGEALEIAKQLAAMGFALYATGGTALYLNRNGVQAQAVARISSGDHPNVEDVLGEQEFAFVVNTPTHGREPMRDGFRIRRMAVERGIPCFTSLDTLRVFVDCLRENIGVENMLPACMTDLKV